MPGRITAGINSNELIDKSLLSTAIIGIKIKIRTIKDDTRETNIFLCLTFLHAINPLIKEETAPMLR